MHKELPEHLELKEYLLGLVDLDAAGERIERRLMLDEEYYEDMLSVEEDLIQDYVDGQLEPAEIRAFEEHFLISDDRRSRMQFARIFRKYVDEQETEAALPAPAPAKKKTGFAAIFSFSPVFRIPAAVGVIAVLLVAGYFGWSAYSRYAQTQQTIVALNKAYRLERPFASRISTFEHAPYYKTRGDGPSQVDDAALNRARAGAFNDPSDLLLQGRFYLANKEFDKAIKVLQEVNAREPENAGALNDLGVAQMELGQTLEDKGAGLKINGEAFLSFKKALDLDPNLLEALFNKARCLELSPLPIQAKEAWQEYLKHDNSSKWAHEARQNLADLEQLQSGNISDDELESAFLQTAEKNAGDEAIILIGRNRELISKKYLPQKLAFSLVDAAPERRARLIGALKYLGKLEKAEINDSLASDLAAYYDSLPGDKYALLKSAHDAMQAGYEAAVNDRSQEAIDKVSEARKLYLQAGDTIEGDVIAKHFIAYYLASKKPAESRALMAEVDDLTRRKNYRWAGLLNRFWIIGMRNPAGFGSLAQQRSDIEDALQTAREIRDTFMIQQLLSLSLQEAFFVKQDTQKFKYLNELLHISNNPYTGARQKMRNYSRAARVLATNDLAAFSYAIVREGMAYVDPDKGQVFRIDAQRNAAVAAMQSSNYLEAGEWLELAGQGTESLNDPVKRDGMRARNLLRAGDLEIRKKNYGPAAEIFEQASMLLGRESNEALLYEARKSLLFADQAAGNTARVERELPLILEAAEDTREKLLSDEDRSSFFNFEQQVYDVAIEHTFSARRMDEAFNYAERSSSRSLLDSLQKNKKPEDTSSNYLLSLNEIREQIPQDVQILQYSVLTDRSIAWVITKEKFSAIEIQDGDARLKIKTEAYLKALISRQNDSVSQISNDLYQTLIGPVLPFLDPAKTICIVPGKALFNLSFASLRSPENKFLLEQFSIIYSPSSNVFIAGTREARQREAITDETLLSVGNPAFDRDLIKLDDLVEAADEAKMISGDYAAPKVLIGPDATKKNFRAVLKDFDVIHFAGHYLVDPDSPLSSALVMAKGSGGPNEGFFTNAELREERLPKARLVVLAACQTGVEGYYKGEGMVGLTRTFLSLGVPLVIASQWPVDSRSSARLMKNFHKYRKSGKLSSGSALRNAQLEMLNDPSGAYREPYYWAALAGFGGHTAF